MALASLSEAKFVTSTITIALCIASSPAIMPDLTDFGAMAAQLMAFAPGMPYATAEQIALAIVMADSIPERVGVVREDGLRLRVYPGTQRNDKAVDIVTELLAGERLRIWRVGEAEYTGWLAVTLTIGKDRLGGWVASQFVEMQ